MASQKNINAAFLRKSIFIGGKHIDLGIPYKVIVKKYIFITILTSLDRLLLVILDML